MRPAFFILSAIAMAAVGCRCSLAPAGTSQEIHIVSYNVHNLFDAEESGREYPEFKPSKGKWTRELYAKRLANVVEAVLSVSETEGAGSRRAAAPDILCVQEIENEKVLADLAEHFGRGVYRYWAISGPDESIIHTGILSRFPIVAMRTHSVMDAWGFGPLRDILEVELELGSAERIVMFVCHWKSKLEGEKETESGRRAAAALLAQRIRGLQTEKPSLPIVVCGDFNESPDEYIRVSRRYPTAIMPSDAGTPPSAAEGEPICVSGSWAGLANTGEDQPFSNENAPKLILYNPWNEISDGFSIAFQEKREQFDCFFLNANLHDGEGVEYESFGVANAPMLFDSNGTPFEWRGSEGYSDHLPVELILSMREGR
ncbi:MAG: endonuclease/exonuclease/phosphatase family protein [Rectinema sp.]|uniref:Putative Endonuclease/exonuclease/phosphatase n=1 Tax=uncultured spirochete TaxID=156406 RepID=A0A3P3XP86_9SPIR|nr:putative Endonuclease/exonuclease/phosphatase [uncultured spirochete]